MNEEPRYRYPRHHSTCELERLRKEALELEDKINTEMLLGGMTYQRFMILWHIAEEKDTIECMRTRMRLWRMIATKQVKELEQMGLIKLSGRKAGVKGIHHLYKITQEGRRVLDICYAIWDGIA